MESLIGGPELEMTECRRGQQVDIGPPEPPAEETVSVEEVHCFVVGRDERTREPSEEIEGRRPFAKCAARELADDRGVTCHVTGVQHLHEGGNAAAEVVDPK